MPIIDTYRPVLVPGRRAKSAITFPSETVATRAQNKHRRGRETAEFQTRHFGGFR
jgi:hypothetical protein